MFERFYLRGVWIYIVVFFGILYFIPDIGENGCLPWMDSSGLFCVVRDTSKEPISGEMALLTFLSNLSTFLVLIYWPKSPLHNLGLLK